MNLDIFNNLLKSNKEKNFIQDFVKELSDSLNKNNELFKKDSSVNDFEKEEDCLYQVVDRGTNGIFLQNTKNNKIFETTNIPKDIQDKIENDYILRYKDREYIIEEELTDKFMNSLVDIAEYKKIQESFERTSNILKIDSDTRYNVVERKEKYSVLCYGDNKIIDVPNELLPFFIDNDTVLYYEDGKFEKDYNEF